METARGSIRFPMLLRLPFFGGAKAITVSDKIKMLKATMGKLILVFLKNGIILV
jgi:hypothetical protein